MKWISYCILLNWTHLINTKISHIICMCQLENPLVMIFFYFVMISTSMQLAHFLFILCFFTFLPYVFVRIMRQTAWRYFRLNQALFLFRFSLVNSSLLFCTSTCCHVDFSLNKGQSFDLASFILLLYFTLTKKK